MADETEVTVTVVPATETAPESAPVIVTTAPAAATDSLALEVGRIGATVEALAAKVEEIQATAEAAQSTARMAADIATMPTPEPATEPVAEIEEIQASPAPESESAGVPASAPSWWREMLI